MFPEILPRRAEFKPPIFLKPASLPGNRVRLCPAYAGNEPIAALCASKRQQGL